MPCDVCRTPQQRRMTMGFAAFLVLTIVIRVWIILLNSYNTYIEIIISIVTMMVFFYIYLRARGNEEAVIVANSSRSSQEVDLSRYMIWSFEQYPAFQEGSSLNSPNQGLSLHLFSKLRRSVFGIDDEKIHSIVKRDFPSTSCNHHIEEDSEEKESKCAICLDDFVYQDSLIHLPCSHFFHDRCIVHWLQSKIRCPMCNQNVRELLLKNYSTKSLRCFNSDSQQTPPASPSDSPSITDLIEEQIHRQQQEENREIDSTIELDLENGIEETNRTS
jgi:hypothetical protein